MLLGKFDVPNPKIYGYASVGIAMRSYKDNLSLHVRVSQASFGGHNYSF
jgi:hypothetical protein